MTQTLTTRLTDLGISPTPIPQSEQIYRSPVTPPPPIPASLSVASSRLNLFNFSHSPASTQTDSRTQAIGTLLFDNSNALARAEGTAGFRGGPIVPLPETVSSLTALNVTTGNGPGYNADAFTSNFVKGLDFYIKPKETFKFDLNGFLALDTQSTSSREKSIAQGKISIIVYATDACGITTAIDRLLINGKQNGNNTGLNLNFSKGFRLNTQTTPLSLSANELSFNGTYSRTFKTATTLTFIATQDTSTNARRNPPSIKEAKPRPRLA
jgi:hypothetical protein